MIVDIKLEPFGIMPQKEFPTSAGYDLFIPEDMVVEMGRQVIPLNFRIKLPVGYGAFIFNRSGTAAKGMKGCSIYDRFVEYRNDADTNLGLVDCGYEGIVGLLVHNKGQAFKLKRGDSVAQMVIIKCESPELNKVEQFVFESDRGKQGFNA